MSPPSSRRPPHAPLLVCGALTPLFVVTFLIEGLTRPGYNPARDFVSALSLGDFGWIQVANFLVTGALLLCLCAALARTDWPGRSSVASRALLPAFALAHIAAGVFVTGPSNGYPPGAVPAASLHALVHSAAALIIFTALPAACFALVPRFAREPGWTRWAPGSAGTGVAILAFFVASLAATHGTAGVASVAGLLQRGAIVTAFSWVAALSLKLLRTPVAGGADDPTSAPSRRLR